MIFTVFIQRFPHNKTDGLDPGIPEATLRKCKERLQYFMLCNGVAVQITTKWTFFLSSTYHIYLEVFAFFLRTHQLFSQPVNVTWCNLNCTFNLPSSRLFIVSKILHFPLNVPSLSLLVMSFIPSLMISIYFFFLISTRPFSGLFFCVMLTDASLCSRWSIIPHPTPPQGTTVPQQAAITRASDVRAPHTTTLMHALTDAQSLQISLA